MMRLEARVKAGVDVDGAFFGAAAKVGVRGPFMLMRHTLDQNLDRTIRAYLARRSRVQLALRLTRSEHYTFSDFVVLGRALAAWSPGLLKLLPIGTIEPERAIRAQRAYLAAFFDIHLRGTRSPLLRGPSRAFPEVRFLPRSSRPRLSG